MSAWLLAAVALAYLLAGADLLRHGNIGLGVFLLSCAVGNVGLMIAARS